MAVISVLKTVNMLNIYVKQFFRKVNQEKSSVDIDTEILI